VNGKSSLNVPPPASPLALAKYVLNACVTSTVKLPPPSIVEDDVNVNAAFEISRVGEKPITSTVKPVDVPLMIFTELAVITGALVPMMKLFDGAGVGNTLSVPAVSFVSVSGVYSDSDDAAAVGRFEEECEAALLLFQFLFAVGPQKSCAPLAYTQNVDRIPITVIEVEPFPAKAAQVWNDDERLEFIGFIAGNPEAGEVIPGSGGVRKVRWSRPGTGKRGGVRVIYYFHNESMPLFLLTVYPKSRKDNVSAAELTAMKRITSILRSTYGKAH
jgi:RelE toxin of RelE / RelB toxin-antitoxin system